MKRICLAGALLLGASASAQTLIPGMKKDVVTPHSASATPMGFMALVQFIRFADSCHDRSVSFGSIPAARRAGR